MSRIYISGPMRGRDDYNFPEFKDAATRFRAAQFQVFNPAESFGGDCNLPTDIYLRHDIHALTLCDAISVLPGYESSDGSRLELCIAQHLEMPVLDGKTMRSIYPPICTVVLT